MFRFSKISVLLRSIWGSTLFVNNCIGTLLSKMASQMQWVNPTDKINTTHWMLIKIGKEDSWWEGSVKWGGKKRITFILKVHLIKECFEKNSSFIHTLKDYNLLDMHREHWWKPGSSGIHGVLFNESGGLVHHLDQPSILLTHLALVHCPTCSTAVTQSAVSCPQNLETLPLSRGSQGQPGSQGTNL